MVQTWVWVPCMGEMDVSDEPMVDDTGTVDELFAVWFRAAEPQLRAGLVATFGFELGRDAAAEALAYAWEHRGRVLRLDNSTGYVFRVGQRWAQRQRSRRQRRFGMAQTHNEYPAFEPALGKALRSLSTRQRQVVVLCLGYGLTQGEAADVLSISRSSVQNHVERGLRHLRNEVGQ